MHIPADLLPNCIGFLYRKGSVGADIQLPQSLNSNYFSVIFCLMAKCPNLETLLPRGCFCVGGALWRKGIQSFLCKRAVTNDHHRPCVSYV